MLRALVAIAVVLISPSCTYPVMIEETPVAGGGVGGGTGGATSASVTVLPVSLPTPVHEPAVAYDGQWVWIFGGLTSSGVFSDAVLKFDPSTETLQTTALRLPFGRQSSSAIAYKGFIYLFGGRSTQSVLLTQILRFDPSTGLFTVMSATLPTARYNMALGPGANSILVFGGYDYTKLSDVLSYDPSADVLTALPASLSPGRESPVAVRSGSQIYLLGGSTITSFLTRIDRFDVASQQLVATNAVLPQEAWQPAPMVIDGVAYMYGGNGVSSVTRFDPATEQAALVPGVTIPHTHMGRGALGVEGRGYVFGGSNASGSQTFDTIIRFVP
ncbi:MAG: kelch repeat-containing protein [Archangium sp.]|nr:kelch repeat-containing protein [Archangium sp.]